MAEQTTPAGAPAQPGALTFSCRCISEGAGEGAALLSRDALCFALCDPTTGTVIEKGHALDCQSVAGRVLIMPTGKGSSVVQADGLYRLIINNVAPAAVVLERPEPVIVSTIIAMEIPLVDEVDEGFYEAVENGDAVRVDATSGTVTVTKAGAGAAAPAGA